MLLLPSVRSRKGGSWFSFPVATLFTATAFLCLALCYAEERILAIRVGAAVGRDGACAAIYPDIVDGYNYFFDWFSRHPAHVITDASGISYTIQLQLRIAPHNCTEAGRADAVASLISGVNANPATGAPAQPPVHLLLGGNAVHAENDAVQADAASRILLHCCSATDSVYKLDLPYVYGILTPASLYMNPVLRTMAVRGLSRVAIALSQDSTLHAPMCQSALEQLPTLQELWPAFRNVLVLNYTAAEIKAAGGGGGGSSGSTGGGSPSAFWQTASGTIAAAGADVLIACDDMANAASLLQALHQRRHRLSAVWLASCVSPADFVASLAGVAEYALTTVQWMPTLPYADPVFGTAAQYTNTFMARHGRRPSYYAASASASAYVLWLALSQVVSRCSLAGVAAAASNTGNATADVFMWQGGALTCQDRSYSSGGSGVRGTTGSDALRYALGTSSVETFFGPVGFNGYRQNVQHQSIVAQVLDGGMAAVLPLDVADRALVMPIPPEPSPGKPWPQTTAGISIITLACCLVAVCLVLGLIMGRRCLAPRLSVASAVEIDYKAIKVDIAPSLNADGTFEPGDGIYKGTRVKLVVAVELLSAANTPKPAKLVPSLSGNLNMDDRATQRPALPAVLSAFFSEPKTPHSQKSQSHMQLHSQQSSKTGFEDAPAAAVALPAGSVRATDASCRGVLRKPSDFNSFLKPSDMAFRRQSEAVLPTTSAGTHGYGGRPTLVGSLARRSRAQIHAMLWRMVRLQHPRMCQVMGLVREWPGVLEGGACVPVLVRQWQEFDNLERLLDNETVPLPMLTKANILLGVAEALTFLHAQDPPIYAGPLEAARIIIDKHFNPHIFLRLRNLDPELPNEAAAAARARARPTTAFGTSANSHANFTRQVTGTSVNGTGPASCNNSPILQPRSLAPTAAVLQSPEKRVSGERDTGDSVLPFASAAPPNVPLLLKLSRDLIPPGADSGGGGGILAGGGGGGGIATGGGGGTNSGVVARASPVAADSSLAVPWARVAALSAASPAQPPSQQPPMPYFPSREQDVYEFGLLLCRMFVTPSPADSGRLRFTLRQGAGSGLDAEQLPWGPVPQLLDEADIEDALAELTALADELGELARSCLARDPHLTAGGLVRAMEAGVIPALTNAGPAMLLSKWASGASLHDRAMSRRIGVSAGGMGTAAALALSDLEAQSTSSCSEPVERPVTAGPARAEVTVVGPMALGRSAGSITAAKNDTLRIARATLHGAQLPTITPDDLIYDIFPPKVARALQAGETVQPERYECVSIFFSDVVGYTDLCGQLQPNEVMDLVHRLYSRFDDLIRDMKLFKVETVGDAYLAVGNLRWPQPDTHARLMAKFAFEAVRAANSLPVHPDRPELGFVHIRVGLHCGPVVGSVVGTMNRRYCLFGDAVNTAARMEHNSLADKVHCSGAFAALLQEQWPGGAEVVSRGIRQIKGKGPMETFWLEERPLPEGLLEQARTTVDVGDIPQLGTYPGDDMPGEAV